MSDTRKHLVFLRRTVAQYMDRHPAPPVQFRLGVEVMLAAVDDLHNTMPGIFAALLQPGEHLIGEHREDGNPLVTFPGERLSYGCTVVLDDSLGDREVVMCDKDGELLRFVYDWTKASLPIPAKGCDIETYRAFVSKVTRGRIQLTPTRSSE